MLKFLGIGSCFNTEVGNTSAYYIENETLFLIDCGESIFERIMKRNILEKIKRIDILITHLHSDHAGSLPSLLFFCEYALQIKPTIIYPDIKTLKEYLKIVGNEPDWYETVIPEDYQKYSIETIKHKHSNFIDAYGYIIKINNQKIYYSGDTSVIPDEIIASFKNNEFNYFYHDVTKYVNEAHMNIDTLKELIPIDKRKNITCMHFDDNETVILAKQAGFTLAEVQDEN